MGILYAGVYSHGPQKLQIEGVTRDEVAQFHRERQEAIEDTFRRDIHDGMEFLGQVAFAVMDREYDARFEPTIEAMVYEQADGRKCVHPANGFKNG
jgi:hypothetical protein